MRNELSGTTAIANGVVNIPGSNPGDTPPASQVVVADTLPRNEPSGDLAVTSPNGATTLTPDSTGPPDTNDYWFGLITEQEAAAFMKMTTRWFQAKRQHGGGQILFVFPSAVSVTAGLTSRPTPKPGSVSPRQMTA